MILHHVERARSEFTGMLEYKDATQLDRNTAQKGLDLIDALQSAEGPEKWIDYCGHLTLAIYHASRFGLEGKRARPQIFIDPRHPTAFGKIEYLLPHDERPWEYAMGFAKDVTDATAMIVDALNRCENRAEYLYESLADEIG